MSYIDTIKHELVGYFNGLPIYHPLEECKAGNWGNFDFSCAPNNIILGGGSGEHPALVMHDLTALAAGYLLESIERIREFHPDYSFDLSENTLNILNGLYAERPPLEFCSWSMQHIHDFVELAQSPLHCTPLIKDEPVEDWIENSIGEFIFYSLPELLTSEINLFQLIETENWHPGYWMKNVVCPPPNYIKTLEKSLNDDGFREIGFFRWDYKVSHDN